MKKNKSPKIKQALNINIIFLNSLGLTVEIPGVVVEYHDMKIQNSMGFNVGSITLIGNELKIHAVTFLGSLFSSTALDGPKKEILYYSFLLPVDGQLKGTFDISKRTVDTDDIECFACIEGNYEDSRVAWNFKLPDSYCTLDCKFKNKGGQEETLLLGPASSDRFEPGISYESIIKVPTYHGLDTISRESRLELMGTALLRTSFRLVNDKPMSIAETIGFPGDIYSKETLMKMVKTMKEIEPNFRDPILAINDYLKGWFANLLDLALPEYTDEEIKILFGIERNRVNLQTDEKNLTRLYLDKSTRSRVRR